MTALTRIPPVLVALSVGMTQLSAPVAVASTPTATVLTLEGATIGPGLPAPWNESITDGTICRNAVCTAVPYPSNLGFLGIPAGVHDLDEALAGSTGNTVVLGYSLGAIVASAWLIANANNPDAPDPSTVSFILMGNAARAYGGSGRWIGMVLPPTTKYHVTDVTRQYDWLGDFPDNPLNLVALANAAAGYVFIHTDYRDVDLDDPDDVTWTDGNTTYVFVPTENLPLLEPLRMLGMNELADELNGPLKKIVEEGYDRDLPESATAEVTGDADATTTTTSSTAREYPTASGGARTSTALTTAVAALDKTVLDKTLVDRTLFDKTVLDKAVTKGLQGSWRAPGHAEAGAPNLLRKLRAGIHTALQRVRGQTPTAPRPADASSPRPRTHTSDLSFKPSRALPAAEHQDQQGRPAKEEHDD